MANLIAKILIFFQLFRNMTCGTSKLPPNRRALSLREELGEKRAYTYAQKKLSLAAIYDNRREWEYWFNVVAELSDRPN